MNERTYMKALGISSTEMNAWMRRHIKCSHELDFFAMRLCDRNRAQTINIIHRLRSN